MVKSVIFLAFKCLHREVLFARGLQLVSRSGVFKVFDLYQFQGKVYLPLLSFELVSSAQFPMVSSVMHQ